MKPRIFISAVSSELSSLRQLAAKTLRRLGCEPVWHEIAGAETGDIKESLRKKINECQGLIQIIGRAYGAEPPEADPEFGRISYAQYELLFARRLNKPVWLFFAGDGCTHDRPLEQLDLPPDADHPDPASYQAERRALQDAWRERMGAYVHLSHAAANDHELEVTLKNLRGEFVCVRPRMRTWVVFVLVLAVAASVVLSMFLARWWAT